MYEAGGLPQEPGEDVLDALRRQKAEVHENKSQADIYLHFGQSMAWTLWEELPPEDGRTLRWVASILDRVEAEVNSLWAEREADRDAIQSAADAMATHSRDWSKNDRDAWMYGILLGWGDALEDVASAHRWTSDEVARLAALRARLDADREGAE